MKRFVISVLPYAAALALAACGIEEYAYLEPVTNVNQTAADSLQVTVDLPSDAEQTEYFDEYLIYYKLYTTSNASSENSYIETNRSTIENANENNPTNLETVLKNLNFKTISFGDADADYSALGNPLSKEDSDINGQEIIIDFNPDSRGRNYPVLIKEKEDGKIYIYKLLRNEELGFSEKKEYQDLTYHETFETDEGQDYTGTNGAGFAHAMLFIVASGHDNNMSQLHSTATEIGVFLLEDRD